MANPATVSLWASPVGWTRTPAGAICIPLGEKLNRQGLKLMNDDAIDSRLEWLVTFAELSAIHCPAEMEGGLMSVEPAACSTQQVKGFLG